MAITNSITKTWTRASGGSLSATLTFTGDDENDLSKAVANGVTNHAIGFTTNGTNMQLFYALSDQNVTLKFNSSGSPDLTLTLVANIPYEWDATSGVTNPFPAAITTVYVTNSSGNVANVEVRALSNVYA